MSDEAKPVAAKKTAAKSRRHVAPRAAKAVATVNPDAVEAAPPKVKDPQAGWPIIWIDAVDGMPNYEEVGVNGHVRRIMREVEVAVPPEVVEVLRNAIGTKIVETHDPQGGIMKRLQRFSTIPWRIVGYKS